MPSKKVGEYGSVMAKAYIDSARSAIDNGEYTITVMLCNWNTKTPYRACIISVNDGKKEVINNYNFR